MKKIIIFTVGWEPSFIESLLIPVERKADIIFYHGIVGDASRASFVLKKKPGMNLIPLSIMKNEVLPCPDYELLASLESIGVPTVRSMIQGDRVLRYRPEKESLGYATLLARRICDSLNELRPNVVLGSFDSIHSGIGLAVAKSLGIPWVAMAFPVIPDTLTGFCKGLTPNSLVPITRAVDDSLRMYSDNIRKKVLIGGQNVVAYRAPATFKDWMKQYYFHGLNLFRRMMKSKKTGFDRFTAPTVGERLHDIFRRSLNSVLLPSHKMINVPPKGRFAYYPFHMAPESMVDTWAPFYQNQLAFVAQISLALPVDMEFVVKLHFSDPDNYSRQQLKQLMRLPRLHIAHPNAPGRKFLEKSFLVVGIQGTTCIEAALRGKSVLIFGDSPYLNFPRSERADRPDKLYRQIQHMLELSPPNDEEIIEAFATYMSRYMPGRINDWNIPNGKDELSRWTECFQSLRSYIDTPGNIENWYRTPPFVNEQPNKLKI